MALFLPTFSVIMGKVLFKSMKNNVLKTLFGGLSFIAIKGTLKIILQCNEFVRKKHKRILDYNEANLFEFRNDRVNISLSDFGTESTESSDSNSSMELLILENIMQTR